LQEFSLFIKFLCIIRTKGNGEVEFNEFAIWMSIKQSDKNQISMDLENTFKIFDENGDHFIVRIYFYLIERRILSKYLLFFSRLAKS
jgi:Ca2+-binding EF-hand superfamily protein